MRWAVCTVPMATAILSRGADSAAIDKVSGPYPAKNPCRARSANSCQGLVTNAIDVITTMKLTKARWTSSLLPNRSPTRPHSGPVKAAIAGETPRVTPVHSAMSPISVTPSSRK